MFRIETFLDDARRSHLAANEMNRVQVTRAVCVFLLLLLF